MKKSFVIVFALLMVVVACNKQVDINVANVAGTWSASSFKSTIPDVPEEYAEAGEKEFLSSKYTLNKDNTFELFSDYFEKGARGRWDFDAEKNELSFFYEMDSVKGVEIYTIKELTAKSITLHQDIPDMDAYVEIKLKK